MGFVVQILEGTQWVTLEGRVFETLEGAVDFADRISSKERVDTRVVVAK